jgi:hypothetical protein
MLSASRETPGLFDRLDTFRFIPGEDVLEYPNDFLKLSKLELFPLHAKFFCAVKEKNFGLVSAIISVVRDKGIKLQVDPEESTQEDLIVFGISCVERRRLYVNDENQKMICNEIKLFCKLCHFYLDDTKWDKKNEQAEAQYQGLLSLCEWVGFDSQSYLSTVPIKVIGFLKEGYKNLIEKNHALHHLLDNYSQEKETVENIGFFWMSFQRLHCQFDRSPLLALFKQFMKQGLDHHRHIIKAESTPMQNLAALIESGLNERTKFIHPFEEENIQSVFKELYFFLEKSAKLSPEIKEGISAQLCIGIIYLFSPHYDTSLKDKNTFLKFSSIVTMSEEMPKPLKDRIKKVSEWVLKKSQVSRPFLLIQKEEVCPPFRIGLLHGLLILPKNVKESEPQQVAAGKENYQKKN